MSRVELKMMPYRHGLWCIGKEETEVIDVTCKDNCSSKQFLDGQKVKTIVFRGSISECEKYLKDNE